MRWMKASALVVGFYITLFILGIYRNIEMYRELKDNIVDKNIILNSVKASTINGQDDLRNSRYEVLGEYARVHLLESIYAGENRILKNEKDEICPQVKHEIKGNEIIVRKMEFKIRNKGIRREGLSASKNKERNYFYAYGNRYHRKMSCEERKGVDIRIFSSMEEAAKEGLFPCEHCILKNLEKEGKKEN